MQLNKLSVMAIALGVLSSTSVMAVSSGTITFGGEVLAATCEVTLNSSSSATGDITLPPAAVSNLDVAAKTAGKISFTLALKNCATSDYKGTPIIPFAYFSNGSTSATLPNTASSKDAAGNVDIELLDYNGIAIKINDIISQRTQAASTPFTSGSHNLLYFAQYKATGPATAGKVASTVNYNIEYK
ncbi:type 1 fimbrial protein [Xenorhabdus sp. Vera]|uniref:fimbrial protein n=1 Tax=Xenorhabdus koppenhoeferi TaxID=351659 RepID=UPI0019C12B78|nr:fimbrial protein [Xenorhabdus sp. Vera]MBD2810774.1 type 1 fimbrial protein [Xenorhabdus sp. Vera]